MADKTVQAYDPARKAVVEVPVSQEKLLQDAGYKTGPEAEYEARVNGWEGTLASALLGAGRKASFGMNDFLVPDSLKSVQRHVEELHPIAKELGGLPSVMARQVLTGPVGNVLSSGVAGGLEAAAEARKYDHPITAEHVMQGALWEAAMAGLAETAGLALKGAVPAGRAALTKLAKIMPREVSGTVADELPALAETAPVSGTGLFPEAPPPLPRAPDASLKGLAARELGPEVPAAFAPSGPTNPALGRELPGKFKNPLSREAEVALAFMAPKAISAPVIAANRGIPAALNRLTTTNKALASVVEGPVRAAADAVKVILGGAGSAVAGGKIGDLDAEYKAASQAVQTAATNPMALHDTLDSQYGHVFQDHPQVWGGAMARSTALAGILNGLLPRNPHEPTLTNADVEPPRTIKMKWMRLYHGANDASALADPYPELIDVWKQVHPETLNLLQQQLISALQDPKTAKNLTNAQARKISIILEQPVRPETSQQFLARLQETAKPQEEQPQQQSMGGAPPNKLAHQVAIMGAPQMLQNQVQ